MAKALKPRREAWETDCLLTHNRVLTGIKCHWCPDWDLMPIDETCSEFGSCTCQFEDDKKCK